MLDKKQKIAAGKCKFEESEEQYNEFNLREVWRLFDTEHNS